MSKKILIYIEKNYDVELVKKAQELADKLNGAEVTGISLFPLDFTQTYFDKIYYVDNQDFEKYSTEKFSKVIIDLINELKPEIVLIGATTQGRDLAPRIASYLKTGLTADCTDLDIDDNGKLAATRPTFGGKLMAKILSKNMPQMATVRPNAILGKNVVLKETEFIKYEPYVNTVFSNAELIESIKKEIKPNNLDKSEIVIAGGLGIKDNLDLLYKVAEKIGAAVGVSRAIVNMGLSDNSNQIGQTGKSISPKVYIACGISGAMQHVVGIMGAKKIIAINKDKNAPIFKIADFGIVGDAVEILNKLLEDL